MYVGGLDSQTRGSRTGDPLHGMCLGEGVCAVARDNLMMDGRVDGWMDGEWPDWMVDAWMGG